MKLAGKVISFLIISIFVTIFISGCDFPSNITVTSIEVDQTTIAEVYDVDEFTPTNIKINVTWSDDSVTKIALTDTMVSPETLEMFQISGEHLITVTYEGETTSFVIKLADDLPIGIDDIMDKEITLDFAILLGPMRGEIATLVHEFNTLYPKITINLDAKEAFYDSLRSATLMDILANQAPDLVLGYPEHFAEYYSAGTLVNLSTFIENEEYGFTESELSDFVDGFLDDNRGFNSEFPEDLFGLPFMESTEVLIYNKTFFEGLYGEAWETKIPKTWQEFETLGADILTRVANQEADDIFVKRSDPAIPEKTYLKLSDYLTSDMFYPLGFGSLENAFITMSNQFGGTYTERVDAENGFVRFDNAQTIAGLDYFQGLSNAGMLGTAATFGENNCSRAFKAIKCVMTIGYNSGIGANGDWDSEYDYELGAAPIPYFSADKKYVMQRGTSIAMLNQNSDEEKLAAWLFLKFLMEPAHTDQLTRALGSFLPVRKSAYALTAYTEFLTNPTTIQIPYSQAANVFLNNYLQGDYLFIIEEAFVGSGDIRFEAGLTFEAIIANNANVQIRIDRALLTLKSFVEEPVS